MDALRGSGQRGGSIQAALRAVAARVLGGGLTRHLELERSRWFLWLPVAFGAGIAIYFSLRAEPGAWTALALPLVALGLVAASRRAGLARLAALALLAMCLGFAVAKARAEWTRAPVLSHELRRADISGVVELIEPRPTRGERLTIRVTDIAGLSPDARPARVRVRVMTKREGLKPGDAIRMRATLRPPAIPPLPGAYDFSRWAWFQGIGATGFAVQAPDIVAVADTASLSQSLRAGLERLRQAVGDRVRAAVPGETGAIATSLLTGERGGITDATNDAYRDSGLVHILSISGLHMVIMAGSVFLAVRLVLAAFPAVALRHATKKWAAAAALAGGFGYLLISGGSIPTIRAFIMIAIMFVAVMLDRQALAMRNVAIAALVVLVAMPESLLDAGFQMSFAAVVCLIAAYEAIRDGAGERDRSGWLRTVLFFFGGILGSTIIASLAVTPFGLFHFQRSQQYALLANLIAIPICNLVVMPGALLTLVLMPLGLEALPLKLMAFGIDAMTATAYWVASLPGAVAYIPEIPQTSFALMVAGGLWLTLWQTRWRALGLAAIGGGILLAGGGARPDILAGRGGELVAVRGTDGRLAARGTRGGSFELTRWLGSDGDGRAARDVLRSRAFRCDGTGCTATVKGFRVAIARHPSAIVEDCVKSEIVITETRPPRGCIAPLIVIDRWALRREGTHTLYLEAGEGNSPGRIARIETVENRRGLRPWTQRPDATRRERHAE
ncbi:ComEC/Rec2 family competence protein [Hyphomicrobium sp.]|uniref:ComEC/Rec2 family competence protein n=1 Tax=Hyphomicrobium sp. TaxID=82 RepID=UPI0025BF36A8|nr:ComEC/Rec2 family competence protein [Hyphomicrobium sp.]MCC7251711.1 ComEC/Rec2 family competence protein [Hyphomicrobium sp.]